MDSRVGEDPISDPDTAIMEMLLALLGRPNFTGRIAKLIVPIGISAAPNCAGKAGAGSVNGNEGE
jgi:hypothetical protein